MSRLDYVTITIVVICLFALGFLVWKTVGLMTKDNSKKNNRTEQLAENTTSEESGTYDFDDEGAVVTDEEDAEGALNDQDLDDEELDGSTDYELVDEEETAPVDDTSLSEDTESLDAEEDDLEEEEQPDSFDSSAGSSGRYMVLAGSFSVRGNAERQVRKLKRLGYDEAGVEVFDRGAYAVVLVNRFESLTDAKSLVKELKSEHGISSFVKKKE